jgi:hypothetical protein
LREYFVTAFKVLPRLKVSFGDQLIRVYGDMAVNTGYYTFSYGNDGETKTLPARYSFHLRQEWRSMAHRRSSFVGHAASPEITRGCGVLHFLTMSYEAPFSRSDGRST